MIERQRCQELLAINRAIASAEDYDEVLRRVVDRTVAFTGATACMLLLSQGDGMARVVRSVGIDPALAAQLAVPLTERIDIELGSVLRLKVKDRFLAVPVIGKDGLMGLLAVCWQEPPFADGVPDGQLISALADQAAIALDKAESLRKLRISEAKLAGIISLAADAIISVDDAQRIVMYNQGAQSIFGWSEEEVLGKPLDLLLPERLRLIHRDHVRSFGEDERAARRMGDLSHTRFIGLRKDGQEFPADAAISKLNVGGAWLFTVVLRDITEQKRIAHEQWFLAEVGEILAATLDPGKTLANVAELAVREFGDLCYVEYIDEQEGTSRVEIVTSDPDKKAIAEALKELPLDGSRPPLRSSILQSKQPHWVTQVTPETRRAAARSEEHLRLLQELAAQSVMGFPLVVHDRLLGALVVVSCRPGRRYGENDFRLMTEVSRRAALALENARLHRAAQRALQARDEVLGIVAHDLRNPLSTILVSNSVALFRRGEAQAGRRDPAELIESAAKRMDRLIQDLLDVTRIEAGALFIDRARVPAAQVLLESAQAQQAIVSSASQELKVDVASKLPDIWADRDRLLQVLQNLIQNATKCTPPGGRINLGARRHEGSVLFYVTDTGTGISPDDLPRLFDRFWRARRTGRQGAGLGLSIAKGIVEAHRGRIWAESTPGKGSTFYFTVPVAVADSPGTPPLSLA